MALARARSWKRFAKTSISFAMIPVLLFATPLHAANTIVYWSPVMSVETYLQCNARVHRAGQKNPTTVVHLQGSGVERRMYTMLNSKVDIHHKIIQLYGELLR